MLARIATGLLLAGLLGHPVQAEQTMPLHAMARHQSGSFKKFVYGFPVPNGTQFTGFSGTVSANSAKASFNEALISVSELAKGACPGQGEEFDSYDQIGARYPGSKQLGKWIIKNVTAGSSSLPVSIQLPAAVPLTNCLMVVLDGSILTGGAYTMQSALTLHYQTGTTGKAALQPQAFGDEVCFGTGAGCGSFHTADDRLSFAYLGPVMTRPTLLVSLSGSAASSPLSPDLSAKLATSQPRGAWSIINEVVMLRECSGLKRGLNGPGDFYERLLPGAVPIWSNSLHGNGPRTEQQPIHQVFTDVVIPAGGCLAHVVRKTGVGGINSEFQTTMFTMPK
jgi:hypothetical protein